MTTTEKDNANALIELEKIRIDKYKQTRELEFKVNIALWTLIVLIGYHYKDKFVLDTTNDLVFYLIVALVIVLGHFFFWLVPVSRSLARDKAKALKFQFEVEKLTGMDVKDVERDETGIKKDYINWNLFLAGITLLLLILSGISFKI